MINYTTIFIFSFFALSVHAQEAVTTFEMRHITSNKKADGETDFHGDKEWMTLDQRVSFLKNYANYSSSFFGDKHLDKALVNKKEVGDLLKGIKPQPLTTTRETRRLKDWNAYGYRKGKEEAKLLEQKKWVLGKGARVSSGKMKIENSSVERSVDHLDWRFRLKTTFLKLDSDVEIALRDGNQELLSLRLGRNSIAMSAGSNKVNQNYPIQDRLEVELYVDLESNRAFSTINGQINELKIDLPAGKSFQKITMSSSGRVDIDDILLFNFLRDTSNKHTPFSSVLAIDDDFEEVPKMEYWQALGYDDSAWNKVELPSVHGGLREKEEWYYLRKVVKLDSYGRAILKMETLDPGGEVWINGDPVAVIRNRHPYDLDVTEYLKPNAENIIAIRVKPYKAMHPMGHSASDPYIGWFLGRTELILTSRSMIKDVFVHTSFIGANAKQTNQVTVQYNGIYALEGSVEINYYPWFPTEGAKVASVKKDIHIRPSIGNEIVLPLTIEDPQLWDPDSPNLYKVEVLLKNSKGEIIDDYVTTTGLRTIEQKHGNLYINNKPQLLNGAQIMGSRYPIETIAKTNRNVSSETVVQDLLMIKKMNGNMLRIHVHAEKDTTDGINDSRYAEYADQMGVYLLWQTAAWIREGEAWNVDFEGYPKFMKRVYNHPSIVMWEASNHPNRFKRHDVSDSHDYMKTIYETISGADTSRLISPTSFWQHSHYGNYDGSLDYKGNPLEPNPVLMEKLMTRGSQDAYTGYGAKWSSLRNAPNKWAASCLEADDKAYFNFEHEESASQPNWELAKMEPWYKVQSYEWGYEKGSIGRLLDASEWRESQAFQAFAAWESMKKQILLGYDGFSWCSLESGSNMFTYQKPLIDAFGVPKLAFHTNKMAFNKIWAGSNNVDVVYGPNDYITPVIFSLGDASQVNLTVELTTVEGRRVDKKEFKNVNIDAGRTVVELERCKFKKTKDGNYIVRYVVEKN